MKIRHPLGLRHSVQILTNDYYDNKRDLLMTLTE